MQDVWDFDVRFLTGFFDCKQRTLENIGEKIGLGFGDKPFHISFRTEDGLNNRPNYTFVLGAHSPQHPVYRDEDRDHGWFLGQEALDLPWWMHPDESSNTGFWTSRFQDYMRNDVPTWGSSQMAVPQWRHKVREQARLVLGQRAHLQKQKRWKAAEDERQELPADPYEALRNEHLTRKRKAWLREGGAGTTIAPRPLPNLGKVASKRLKQEAFDKFWTEGIHANLIFVGQSLPSANSRANCTRKWLEARSARWHQRQAAVAASRKRRAGHGSRAGQSAARGASRP